MAITGANLGFEQKLWQAADKMRNNMDAAVWNQIKKCPNCGKELRNYGFLGKLWGLDNE